MTTTSLPSGFIKARAQPIVNSAPESPIPDFPKWVISRHVTSLNRTTQNCSGVSTLESLDPLSLGLPIPRTPMSRNGRSYDTWPPSIGWLRPILGFPQWKVPISCQQESRLRHVASVNRTTQIYSRVSIMESPELLSTGVPIPRFPIHGGF
jgi:hypothetical protein